MVVLAQTVPVQQLTVEMVAVVAGQMEFLLLLEVLAVLDSTEVHGLRVVQTILIAAVAVVAWDRPAQQETAEQV